MRNLHLCADQSQPSFCRTSVHPVKMTFSSVTLFLNIQFFTWRYNKYELFWCRSAAVQYSVAIYFCCKKLSFPNWSKDTQGFRRCRQERQSGIKYACSSSTCVPAQYSVLNPAFTWTTNFTQIFLVACKPGILHGALLILGCHQRASFSYSTLIDTNRLGYLWLAATRNGRESTNAVPIQLGLPRFDSRVCGFGVRSWGCYSQCTGVWSYWLSTGPTDTVCSDNNSRLSSTQKWSLDCTKCACSNNDATASTVTNQSIRKGWCRRNGR